MKEPLLVFVHGWGFGPSFWEPLLAEPALASSESLVVDLGFFGGATAALPTDRPLVGVGHSLGFLWLLRQRLPWLGLVSINGFARFTNGPDFPEGVHPRLLARMQRRLGDDPEGVAKDFLRRCGVMAPETAGLDSARLGEGLEWLATWDEREALAEKRDILALAGQDDPIVPAAMSEATYARLAGGHPEGAAGTEGSPSSRQKETRIEVATGGVGGGSLRFRGGGHLLPLTDPGWCARELSRFLEGLG